MRIVSGIQPTGPLHLGNYLGAVKNWLDLQSKHDCLFFVADYHSLTENYDPRQKPNQIYELAAELLALGLDPKKCTLFVQSDVSEVTELAWVFNTLVSMPELSRMTQFKDKSTRQEQNTKPRTVTPTQIGGSGARVNVGLFDYPVLQAADILIYDGEAVPVGQDQVQHVELTRDIACDFNRKFGKTFPEPKSLLTKNPRVMSLLEPEKKMSKSLGEAHYIALTDDPETIKKKIARAITDAGPALSGPEALIAPSGPEAPRALRAQQALQAGKPASSLRASVSERGNLITMSNGTRNLFTLLDQFGTKSDITKFQNAYQNKTIKYAELKETLSLLISKYFTDFRKKRANLLSDKNKLDKILSSGAKAARDLAQKKMKEVRKKIGLIH